MSSNSKARKRLRLVKVVIQPVFVVDDGSTLNEVSTEPITLAAEQWPGYATGEFVKSVEELEENLNTT